MMKLLALAVFGIIAATTAAPRVPSILEIAESTPELSTLVAAVKAAGLVDALSGPGPFTVFAPTDDAFKELPKGFLEYLLEPEHKQELVEVLTYHVVGAAAYARDLKNGEHIKTLEGDNVTVFLKGNGVIVEGGFRGNFAQVIKADVSASNGVVHIIDRVLLPPRHQPPAPGGKDTILEIAVHTPALSTLVTAVKAAGLVETLNSTGPFTVFAPTNEAFAKLPPAVLKELLMPENKAKLVKVLTYHVVSGNIQAAQIRNDEKVKTVEGDDVTTYIRDQRVFLAGLAPHNFAEVIQADVEASNGVVHVIDEVLLP